MFKVHELGQLIEEMRIGRNRNLHFKTIILLKIDHINHVINGNGKETFLVTHS